MSYLQLLSSNRSSLAFGLLTALSSSVGQTFFVSLFLPSFATTFNLNVGQFGLLYALATLLSALLLPCLGGRIDSIAIRPYTAGTMVGLALSALLVSFSNNVILLGGGLLGLRLFGQGLMGHISHTVMAREFGHSRGKALGFAGVGYPLGEAFLPFLITVALRFVHWRAVWISVGFIVLCVLLPLALRLMRQPSKSPLAGEEANRSRSTLKRPTLWREPGLYYVLPSTLMVPFVLTGLFLYQIPLAQSKGWRLDWMAAAFVAFAITRVFASLAAGPAIDRYTATRLLPLYMLPLAAGVSVLLLGRGPWGAFPYMLLAGITAGASGSIVSAVWAEMFGTENLGAVRSVSAAVAILSAAASPAIMGWMVQCGVSFQQILTVVVWMILISSAASVPVTPWPAEVSRRLGLKDRIRKVELPENSGQLD